MRLSVSVIIAILAALTNAGFSQGDGDPRARYYYDNFTPAVEPGTKFEKIAITSRGNAAFVLINNNGVHSVALYADEPIWEWHTIPLPEEKAEVIDISADNLGYLFAVYRDASGKTVIGYYYDTKWSKKISTEGVDGDITMMLGADHSTTMNVAGNFRVGGHPCHAASYDVRTKKWSPLFGTDDALFENTILKGLAGADMLLKNNNTGKFFLIHYTAENKWETTTAPPGTIISMIRSNGTLYVCGTDDDSKEPYLQRWIKGTWENIPFDKADFTRPEIIVPYDDNIFVAGPSKKTAHYILDSYKFSTKSWEERIGMPANPRIISYAWDQPNQFVITEENGNSFFYREKHFKDAGPPVYGTPVLGAPAGTLEDMARAARKRRATEEYNKAMADLKKVYTSVPEVMEAYRSAYEKDYKFKQPVTFTVKNFQDYNTKELLENIINQSNEVYGSLLGYYQGKLRDVKGMKEEERPLAAAFEKYLTAFIAKVNGVGDGYRSIKGSFEALAREGKPASDYNTSSKGFLLKVEENIRNLNLAINELNVQWKEYYTKTQSKDVSSFLPEMKLR